MTSKAMVPSAGIVPAKMTPEQIELIKNTVCKGATDDELKLFLYTANRTGLDPLARQIHAVKRGGTMTIQTGIDGYRLTADRTKRYAPGPITVTMGQDGKVESATAVVRKLVDGTWHDVSATAYFAEYAVHGSPTWIRMPRVMISKCAEALALRRAFPAELSGVHVADEMENVGSDATPQNIRKPQEMQTKDAPPIKDAEVVDDPAPHPEEPATPPHAPSGGTAISDKQGKMLYARWKEKEIPDAEVKAHLKAKYGYASTREVKAGAEFDAMLAWVASWGS